MTNPPSSRRWRGRLAAVLTGALLLAGLSLPGAAVAAGPAVFDLTVTPVNYATGAPITETASGQNGDRVGYRVAYGCSVADCEDTRVAFTPSQPDPYGLAAQQPANEAVALLSYESWTRPAGAPDVQPTGDDLTGMVFSIGDVPAGSSGSFIVTYRIPDQGPTTGIRTAQFYPDGFSIEMGATISSENAVAPMSVDAPPVIWHSEVPEPTAQLRDQVGAVDPDAVIDMYASMGSGAFVWAPSGPLITGTSQYAAAGSYTVTEYLPEEAEVVEPIAYGGVYDPVAHTVTWTKGTADAPDFGAAGGWGLGQAYGWYGGGDYNLHLVKLSFPGTEFEEADENGCNFEATRQIRLEATVTYLDEAKTTKTVSDTSDVTIACYDPFVESRFAKGVAPRHGTEAGNTILQVPAVGAPAVAGYWQVNADSGANIPGVAVIEDDELDQDDLEVTRINLSSTATVEWTLDTGATGSTVGRTVSAPAGRHFTAVRIVSDELPAGRTRPTDNTFTLFWARFAFAVKSDAPIGEVRENTAHTEISWPSHPEFPAEEADVTRGVVFASTAPTVKASFPVAPVVVGGGSAVPGRDVTFTVGGTTSSVPSGSDFTPEYVFVAPAGWDLRPGSAAFGDDAPQGVDFQYLTRTIGGVERQIVVATWPVGTDFTSVATLPAMTVVATPTFQVAAGTTSTAEARIGDSARLWDSSTATWTAPRQNTGDVDGSGDETAWFSTSTQDVVVLSADGLSVQKEICRPDASEEDGCDWVSDPDQVVPVPLDATGISYRITLQNTGNTTLSDVVGYDVLPYVGDTGLIPATAGTQRGSTFAETLNEIGAASANLTLSFSASTNPSRPEVSDAGTTDDWSAEPAGKQAIRAVVNGSMAPGDTASFEYTAAVAPGSAADAKACNSIAVSSDRSLPSEPRAVCATTAEADLSASGPATIDAQLDRPALFPFEFANLGGSQSAPATVTVGIPDGVTMTGVPDGWTCDPTDTPLDGPATLECTPPADLQKDEPVAFELPAVVTASGVAVTARVTGTMSDPDPDNDEHVIAVPEPADAADGVGVDKSDGVVAVVAGQETTYTITVDNPLEFEALADVRVTDELPAGVDIVSASDGGSADDGVVTWTIAEIPAGGSAEIAVTVRVTDAAADTIANAVEVEVADPAFPDETLTGRATDTDAVDRITLTKTAALSDAATPWPGDTVTYTFVAVNTGGGAFTDVEFTDAMPGLSDVVVEWPSLPGYLAAGEQVTGTATYTLTQQDLDAGTLTNTATVSGESAGGRTATAQAVEEVPLPGAPGIRLTKTGSLRDPGSIAAGDVIDYRFEVENTGNVTLTDVLLLDRLDGVSAVAFDAVAGVAAEDGALAPGESVVAHATYVLTQEDVDRGRVDNTATATATAAGGESPSSIDSVSVPLAAKAALSLEKSGRFAGEGPAAAGDLVDFRFEIENSGDVTVHDVAISDELDGLSDVVFERWPGADGVLEPGQSVVATATYRLTQEDIDRGQVDNTATVDGEAPSGDDVVTLDSVSVPLQAAPAVTLSKAGSVQPDGAPFAGDEVEYTFVVQNTGNVTVTDLEIDDRLPGLSPVRFDGWPAEAGELAPGQSVTATAVYALRQGDIDAGSVTNTATVTALGLRGGIARDDDAAAVALAPAPRLELLKTAELTDADGDGVANPGETIAYVFRIANTGNVTIQDVRVQDAMVTGVGSVDVLAPGETATVRSAAYAVTVADAETGVIRNVATSVGLAPDGAEVVSAEAEASTDAGPAVAVPADDADAVEGELPQTGLAGAGPATLTAGAVILVGLLLLGLAAMRRRRREAGER